ncbi:YlbF family regulator [Paenibacillus sp. GSMTC-2017]|uniref:YlbF family regulator n=1 Tax=Paenibacillus sp. GSMTC-2017 TaxID=2794350 RepID=UPI0018D617E3|nr:YlbF family regulator [Paenibacillus sp. GSMTC-2017]MBH5316777.1 YlbF family regulator [Paenibacillus sp. GSMTC-2017]
MAVAEQWTTASTLQAHGDGSTIDMASLLLSAYEIGDWINDSAEVAEYLYWKSEVSQNEEVKSLQRQFSKAKELFEECQRFGRFHPSYNEAKDKVKLIEKQMAELECVTRFKESEQVVDEMLYEVSRMIAESVSENIKVPSNEKGSGGGCGSGGSCGCGSGGCG